jgi:hypothetical protein
MDTCKIASRVAMARGTVVVDENVQFLASMLRAVNIRTIVPKSSMDDADIVEQLLANRMIITRNSKDFVDKASSYDFGILSLDGLSFIDSEPNPAKNKTVQLISKALIDFGLWSKRHGFLIELRDDGKHAYQDLTE